MAVETYLSRQLIGDMRKRPIDDHGKIRVQYFTVGPLTVAGDANSVFELCDLPPGAVRILPAMSAVQCSAFGAARVLDIGHRAYAKRATGVAADAEPEDLDAFAVGLDIAAAGVDIYNPSDLKFDVYSQAGVRVVAQVRGGTAPIGATLEGYLVYVYE